MNMMKTGSGVKLKADFDKIFKALVNIITYIYILLLYRCYPKSFKMKFSDSNSNK